MNGELIALDIRDHRIVIDREWQHGDMLALTLPMNVFVSRLPDNPNAVGFQYGPVVLSAALGTEDLIQAQTGIMVKRADTQNACQGFLDSDRE